MDRIFQFVIENPEPKENIDNYIIFFDGKSLKCVVCILPVSNESEPTLLN